MRLSFFLFCAALATAPGVAEARGHHGRHFGGHHAATHHRAAHHNPGGHSRHVHSVTRSFVHSVATGAGGQIGRDLVRGAERPSTPPSAASAPKYRHRAAAAPGETCPTSAPACRDFAAAPPQSECARACAAILGATPH